MKPGILVALLVFGCAIGSTTAGGLLSNLFQVEEVSYGTKTHEVLPDLYKEHHHHETIHKPHHDVQHFKSASQQNVKVIHNHHETAKVIHKNHHHEHVLHQHHLHNVHTHNHHTQVNHVHENLLHQEHIHIPVDIKHEHHEHKVTEEKQVKHTQAETHKAVHTTHVHNKQAEPIHQKEWSFSGWLKAWAWG